MKKTSKSLGRIFSIVLCLSMLLGMGGLFAEDVNANKSSPRIPIYQATFPGSQNFFDQTSDIFIQPYGSPVGKTIGSVTLSGWVAWSGLV